MKFLILISVFALALNSCRTTKDASGATDVISIKHGTSYGHCVGYCIREELYSAGQVVFTQISRDEQSNPKKELTETFSDKEFEKLAASIDWSKWKELPESIGCPDCADGGAEYVEVITSSGVKRVTFEAGSTPEGIEKALDVFRAKRLARQAAEENGK